MVWLADFRAYDAHRIFERDMLDRRIEQQSHKVERGLLFTAGTLRWKPSRTTHGEVCAWRMRNHDIGEFIDIVRRHGTYKRDLQLFAESLLKKKNPVFPELEPAQDDSLIPAPSELAEDFDPELDTPEEIEERYRIVRAAMEKVASMPLSALAPKGA